MIGRTGKAKREAEDDLATRIKNRVGEIEEALLDGKVLQLPAKGGSK